MSELLTPLGGSEDVEAAPRTPVLITEQQVLFATAAAVPLRPEKTGRRWIATVCAFAASVSAAFATTDDAARPMRRHYPPRNDFLEDALMAREMWRL